ncbi:glucose-6-phosphate isomerase [Actinophytocola sediminis]
MDLSGFAIEPDRLDALSPRLMRALTAMTDLENGALANADERRQVGHYWLRAPHLAPTSVLDNDIRASWRAITEFADRARAGFDTVLHVGIGGSTTGPRLLCDAWRDRGGLRVRILDNADPDGVVPVLRDLDRTLVSVVSKSGITPTPWQVVRELERAYAAGGVDFAKHAVATTVPGSDLDRHARDRGWLARFPMWDWVGGRTSVTSSVGLLPAALAGADIAAFLAGAAEMDVLTRRRSVRHNPAALLAAAWFHLGDGQGDRNMVVLPYRDRLTVLPGWIQQLVMESVGKKAGRDGRIVHQGMTVYGHKGVTDQHSYLQQLCDGRDDSFVTLIGTHHGETERALELADHLVCGLFGTHAALVARGRPVAVLMLPDYRERAVGALLALYERAVGLYAELIDVNAYHQPAVDKYAAMPILALQREIISQLRTCAEPSTARSLAASIGRPDQADLVHRLLEHLAFARPDLVSAPFGGSPEDTGYLAVGERTHA